VESSLALVVVSSPLMGSACSDAIPKSANLRRIGAGAAGGVDDIGDDVSVFFSSSVVVVGCSIFFDPSACC